MLERYKTLGAMLALGEFSISELTVLSGVRASTVRTIVRRETRYVEQIGTQPSGRRGGQPRRWRVRPSARDGLREELIELERLGEGPWAGDHHEVVDTLPEAIVAAEGVLLREAPAATDPAERDELVKLAETQLEIASMTGTAGASGALESHKRIVRALIDLEQVERLATQPGHSSAALEAPRIVIDLLQAVAEVGGEASLADAVRNRLQSSSVFWGGRVPSLAPSLPSPCAAIGIELMPYELTGVVVDHHGELLASQSMRLDDMGVKATVAGATSLAAKLGKFVPKVSGERVGVGFQLGGPVDTQSGTVLFYRKLPPRDSSEVREIYWPNQQPLRQLLEKNIGLPVVVENDANAFAVYQQWFGVGRRTSRFAVVLLREGVGGSLIIDNKPFDGPMELGNLSVLPDKIKRVCDCGSIGCLETTGGIYGILEAFCDYTGDCPDSIEDAVRVAQSLNTDCGIEPFRLAGEANARGIGIVVNFARPDCVVLYAPPAMTDQSYLAARAFREKVENFRNYCHDTAFGDCELIFEPLRPDIGAHGAALVALERCFEVGPDVALAR